MSTRHGPGAEPVRGIDEMNTRPSHILSDTGLTLEQCSETYQTVSLTYARGIWRLHLVSKGENIILRDANLNSLMARSLVSHA